MADRPTTVWSRVDDTTEITVGGEVVTAPPAPTQQPVTIVAQVTPVPTVWNTET